MRYEFDRMIDRYQTASEKWDGAEKIFGEQNLLPMWVADMDFRSPEPVIEAMKQRVEHGVFGYNLRPDSYYEAIKDWMAVRHNWTIQQDWICYSPGVMPAISLIISYFSEPGDSVLIEPPVYPPFSQVVTRHGRKLVTNPLQYDNGRYQINFADLKRKLDNGVKIMLLCSPHNPVGRVWTRQELTQLGEMCLERNVLVVADEIHADLVYQGSSHTPFSSISEDFAQQSIVCTAPTKTFNLAGIQTANIIIPNPKLREKFKFAIENYFLQFSNTYGMIATERAYRDGAEWLDQCLKYVEQNLRFLTAYVEKQIPEIKVVHPEGTYLAWLDCRELGMDAKTLEQFMLKQANVALVAGDTFGHEGKGFMRMNLATPRVLLDEGLQRIGRAIKSYRESKESF
ncbi:MalY/PatB family protein [Paenactinomyces guangxiensis]|uniref:cysteine-S-conjugate beta-lyase n=1 Tax=Paenactinomyces guangxiensis TaxID=1490290 RepID=A0A7W2A955_9BACL|nr:MalY/PatB family protein [Paenactinomyces guangxiensis]MBA4494568.1 pyridoxal phosphate-dependent aminotransferase [Paenactinomyces guangxiensis]MBH8591669.1 pyridoxal phosphate-dependent aminotransferase [Paenactinomyces guangxiensis]